MHCVQPHVGCRRLKSKAGEQVLVGAEDEAPGGEQVAVLKRTECVADDVTFEREGNFAAGQNVHSVQAQVRAAAGEAMRTLRVAVPMAFAIRWASLSPLLGQNQARTLRLPTETGAVSIFPVRWTCRSDQSSSKFWP